MAENDWGALMTASLAGDATAYRTLLSELDPWLRQFFSRRLPPSVVDDIVQDTLIGIHQKRHTYNSSRPIKPWLAAIARYKHIDYLRTVKRWPGGLRNIRRRHLPLERRSSWLSRWT